jgi:hypothetical protein
MGFDDSKGDQHGLCFDCISCSPMSGCIALVRDNKRSLVWTVAAVVLSADRFSEEYCRQLQVDDHHKLNCPGLCRVVKAIHYITLYYMLHSTRSAVADSEPTRGS